MWRPFWLLNLCPNMCPHVPKIVPVLSNCRYHWMTVEQAVCPTRSAVRIDTQAHLLILVICWTPQLTCKRSQVQVLVRPPNKPPHQAFPGYRHTGQAIYCSCFVTVFRLCSRVLNMARVWARVGFPFKVRGCWFRIPGRGSARTDLYTWPAIGAISLIAPENPQRSRLVGQQPHAIVGRAPFRKVDQVLEQKMCKRREARRGNSR